MYSFIRKFTEDNNAKFTHSFIRKLMSESVTRTENITTLVKEYLLGLQISNEAKIVEFMMLNDGTTLKLQRKAIYGKWEDNKGYYFAFNQFFFRIVDEDGNVIVSTECI